jgi:hypothetical protein
VGRDLLLSKVSGVLEFPVCSMRRAQCLFKDVMGRQHLVWLEARPKTGHLHDVM